MTGTLGVARSESVGPRPPTPRTVPEAIGKIVAIAPSRTRSGIMAVVKAAGYRHGAIAEAALAMSDSPGCSGVAGIGSFLTDHGTVLTEVDTMPGMTIESQVPRTFAVAGVPCEELVARLVGAATVPTAATG